MKKRILAAFVIVACLPSSLFSAERGRILLWMPGPDSPRVRFGTDRLAQALADAGLTAEVFREAAMPGKRPLVAIGNRATTTPIEDLLPDKGNDQEKLAAEGFSLCGRPGDVTVVAGNDETGTLYGCLDLADRVRAGRSLPQDLHVHDGPEFRLRGPCIGMQRPNRGYLCPYTPETFPFFYDRDQWTHYLDLLVELRMNTLFLWNGHPFASLVTLPDYPEAAEVSPEIMQRNRETFHWLTSECDKRGIWLIQKFYNIHLPEGLARKHRLPTSLGKPNPIASDYTRKAIAKFVEEYPNVGLMVCLGEALQGGQPQVDWFVQTILPGVKEGLEARETKELPPIVVRGHSIMESGMHKAVMAAGLREYANLFTMAKFNGESFTTWAPRGNYQRYHHELAASGGIHIVNVHLLSNLEPFRYAGFSFIWKSARAIRDRLAGQGLHLYPLAYWDWPYSLDTAPILQIDRDRLWYEIWARYAWKIDRDERAEREHWIDRLAETFGDRRAAENVYVACDAAAECAPRLLRRFGITGGGRQSLSLGMTLDQMVYADRYHVWKDLRDSDSPPGEDLRTYVARQWQDEPHAGETPPQIIAETLAYARQAAEAVDAAAAHVTKNKEEFGRLRNDVYCIRALTEHYTAKARAAMHVIRYELSKDPQDMTQAESYLEASFRAYQELNELAGPAYRYANSLHTGARTIPVVGVWHWSGMVGVYEKELADFRKQVAALSSPAAQATVASGVSRVQGLMPAPFKLLSPGMEIYAVRKGAKVFTDRDYAIVDVSPKLVGLTGIRFFHAEAKRGKDIVVELEVAEPVKVLVGYFQSEDKQWLQVPNLEYAAHADERGGYEPRLRNAATIEGLPAVNVHAFRYGPGRQKIEMIGKGSYVILGVVPAIAEIAGQSGKESIGEIKTASP